MPDFTNPNDPRVRRPIAHPGEGHHSYANTLGSRSDAAPDLAGGLGSVVVASYTLSYDTRQTVVSGMTPARDAEVRALKANGEPFGYTPDVYLVREGTDASDLAMGGVIDDPLAAGFRPLRDDTDR